MRGEGAKDAGLGMSEGWRSRRGTSERDAKLRASGYSVTVTEIQFGGEPAARGWWLRSIGKMWGTTG